MIETLRQILEKALEQLAATTVAYLPPLLAGLTIFLGALVAAHLIRWTLIRMVKAAAFDRFLAQSGLASMMGRSGRIGAARLVAGTVYWLLILTGFLTGLSAFNTSLTTRIIEASVLLLPKLVAAGAILLAGVWLGRYLGRGVLVWACNEGVPYARHAGAAVRVLVVFVAAVVAAHHLDFARPVFLAAFILVVGGVIVAASVVAGMAGHAALQRRLRGAASPVEEEASLWNHL